ncbi:phage tail protein [Sulfurovum mangrovi]|uniref:phage tail protein n=1 Tax=Sulfurovum mangrovi TaxID=2893889 RepID=UPI001E60C862|nr:phage tail protein [Sulfurovum mangrovi]UFH59979.1 phage tail protein [Sulfurovum mangrovi]
MDRENPLLTHRYRVEIAGLFVAGFSEVSGLEQEIEIEEYKEGGMDFIHKLPAGIKHANVILKRGISGNSSLRTWYDLVLKAITYGNMPIPKEPIVYIALMDSAGNEKIRFMLKFAYPVKWVGPQLNAKTSEVAIESLELVHEGLVVV